MTPTPEVQERLRRYLLGQLADDAREEVEKELLASDEVFQELLMVEDELIDEHLSGQLDAGELRAFEKNFLATPERNQKLKFGLALNRYVESHSAAAPPQQKTLPRSWAWAQSLFSSPLRLAVAAVIVVGVAFGIWRIYFHQSDVDNGLQALNAAYREQRPVESRISGLNYAPFPQTRGGPERVDARARSRAEALLNNAVSESPNAVTHHAIGKVYLAKRNFDDAIREFDEALKSDPSKAQLCSDLGAAWLEKGRIAL
ncbi:MAG: tetratricopeptide repeat protein, partial [Pyrinomonadaceae bacterium]